MNEQMLTDIAGLVLGFIGVITITTLIIWGVVELGITAVGLL